MQTNTYPGPPVGQFLSPQLVPTMPAETYPWAAGLVPPPSPPPVQRARQVPIAATPLQAPGYPAPAQPAGNGLAVAGMVLGIMSLVLDATVIGCALGVPVAIVGLVLSIFGARRPPRGMAIAGIVCSTLGFVVPPLVAVLTLTLTRG